MKTSGFPPGWDRERLQRIIEYYEWRNRRSENIKPAVKSSSSGNHSQKTEAILMPVIYELIKQNKAA